MSVNRTVARTAVGAESGLCAGGDFFYDVDDAVVVANRPEVVDPVQLDEPRVRNVVGHVPSERDRHQLVAGSVHHDCRNANRGEDLPDVGGCGHLQEAPSGARTGGPSLIVRHPGQELLVVGQARSRGSEPPGAPCVADEVHKKVNCLDREPDGIVRCLDGSGEWSVETERLQPVRICRRTRQRHRRTVGTREHGRMYQISGLEHSEQLVDAFLQGRTHAGRNRVGHPDAVLVIADTTTDRG